MRAALSNALAKHVGSVLTLDAAKAVMREACFDEDQAHSPSSFAPLEYGAYTIAVESFRRILPELIPLHEAHWLETESYRKVLPLNANYEAMSTRERAGRLMQFTARQQGKIVAHLRMFISNSLHTQTDFADEDALFVLKEHRGGFLAIKLMRYAEACLRQVGVREFRSNSKLSNNADVLMRRLGYEPVALQFCKIFEE